MRWTREQLARWPHLREQHRQEQRARFADRPRARRFVLQNTPQANQQRRTWKERWAEEHPRLWRAWLEKRQNEE